MSELALAIIILLIVLAIFITFYLYLNRENDSIYQNNIYLDNNGTTQLCKLARDEYVKASDYGNASGIYAKKAKSIIQQNNNLVNKWIQSKYNIIYTSGASESNNQILKAFSHTINGQKPHFIISAYEHKSSLDCAKQLEADGQISLSLVYPDSDGFIQPENIISLINPNTKLISIMHINNETGNINDIQKIAKLVKQTNSNICFHSDVVQSFGKYSIPAELWQIDALSVSYHKLYGPQSIGMLIVNDETMKKLKKYPLINGEQNSGIRGGTMNTAGIAASIKALEFIQQNREQKNFELLKMKNYIINCLSQKYKIGNYQEYYNQPDTFIKDFNGTNKQEIIIMGKGATKRMSPNTLLISVVNYGPMNYHFCNIKLRDELLKHKIIVSIGSACHSENTEPSHVLKVMRAPFIIRCGIIRISLGDFNTLDEIKRFCEILSSCISLQAQN